ncbi:MAG TPA: hypothetical protein VGI17_04255 [Solirubrobacterales bacterium]
MGASTASAILIWPQQIGDRCAATGVAPAQSAILDNNDLVHSDLQFLAPPETPSVITGWKVTTSPGVGPTPQQIVAIRQVGEGGEDQLIGESAVETAVFGAANEFPTRIPVPEYAQIGLRGPGGALVCAEQSMQLAGLVADPWAIGESRPVKVESDTGVPVIATLEPDRDGDGYGDLTQDQCVEQPAIHTACPFVRLMPKTTVFRRGILLELSTGDPTKVEVSGQVAWGYRPRGGGPHKRLVVGLDASSQEVGAGATVQFWVPLPEPVTRRLAKLSRKEKLKAHLTVVATDVVGHQTRRELNVQLSGWVKRKEARTTRTSRSQSAAPAAATLRR